MVLRVLRLLLFPPNESRAYLDAYGSEAVESFTLGLTSGLGDGITSATRQFPFLAMLLCRWYWGQGPGLPFTAIQVNGAHFHTRRHRDSNILGPSALKALGNFSGGNLLLWQRDAGTGSVDFLEVDDAVQADPTDWCVFNGCLAHEVMATEGERFSLVFFRLAVVPENPSAWEHIAWLGFGLDSH